MDARQVDLTPSIGDSEEILRGLRYLIERGAWVQNTGALRAAANRNFEDILQFLLDNGADVDDLGDESSRIHWEQDSALICAANSGHGEIVQRLLAHGANFNHQNRVGSTAVAVAQRNQHVEIVNLLVHHAQTNP